MKLTLKNFLIILTFTLLSVLQSNAQVMLAYDPVSCGVPTTNVTCAVSCGSNTPHYSLVSSDDVYSDALPIGFTFNFYGNSYNNLVIGANGIISFRDSLAKSYNPWSIVGSLASSTIRNSICGPWCDMGLPDDHNAYTYLTSGTAPNRRFIVNYCKLPMYSMAYCPGQWVTSQVILYEGSNIVEVHIGHKTICPAWNNGRAICGVINGSGSSSTIAPLRDWSTNWSANHEAWRFTPVGSAGYSVVSVSYAPAFCGITVYWYDSVTRAYLGAGASLTVSTNVVRHLKAAIFSNCEDTSFYYITVPVPTIRPVPKEILGRHNFCVGETGLFTDSTEGGTWTFSSNLSGAIHANHIDITAIGEGDGSVQYTLPAGCSTAFGVTVNPTPSVITPNPLSLCRGSMVACYDTLLFGLWTSSDTTIARISPSSGVLEGLSVGTSFITYTSPKGCIRTTLATVNPMPSGISPSDTDICKGDSKTFVNTVAGGIWTSINPSIVTINPFTGLISADTPGSTVVRYTLPAGCFTTTNITVKPTPGSISPAPASVCMNATIVLSDVNFGGSWSSGNPAVATVGLGSGIILPVSPGTALITYSFTNGCYRTALLSVNPLPPVIVPTPMNICEGDTKTFGTMPPGGLWSVDNPSLAHIDVVTGMVNGVSPGTTTVSYTMPGGCARTGTVIVNPLPFNITPSPGMVCVGDQLFLSDSTAGGTWSSSNTAIGTVTTNSGIMTGIAPGATIVSYSLSSGCYTTSTVIVSPLPGAISPASLDMCEGGKVTFTAFPPGGTWSSDNPVIAMMDTSGTLTGASSGTATVTYTLGTGCYKTAPVHIAPASAIVPSEAMICTGRSVPFTNTSGSGTWSIGNPAVASITADSLTASVKAISTGITTLTYSFPGGCQRTASITVNATPAGIKGVLSTCALDTTRLTDTAGSGAGAWSSTTPTYATVSSTGLVTGMSGGTTTISYTVANGCAATAIVTVFPLPNAGVITGSNLICRGIAIEQLQNTSGSPGSWYSSNAAVVTIDNNTGMMSGLTAGTAIITYKTAIDSNGCASFTTFSVQVVAAAQFVINGNLTEPKCFGSHDGSILLNISNGSGAYTYKWQDSSTNYLLSSIPQGHYSVLVTDVKTHCVKSDFFTLNEPDSLDVVAEVKPDICSQGIGSIKVTISGGTQPYTSAWSNDSTGTEISGLSAGNYYLALTDVNGCHKFSTIPLRDSVGHIHIHDALSPNGDGYNDVWVVDFIEDNLFNKVQIFNQWGDMIWQRNRYLNDWDGTGMNGEKLPDGTYYYVIRLNNSNPKCSNNLYKGSLLIKR